MPRTCKCGGRFASLSGGGSHYFRVRCDACGVTYKQRKRKAKTPKLAEKGENYVQHELHLRRYMSKRWAKEPPDGKE